MFVTTRKLWWDFHMLVYMKCCFSIQENKWHDVPSHLLSKEHWHTPSCNRIWHCILTKSKWYRCSLQPAGIRDVTSVRTSCSLCSSTLPPSVACDLVMKPVFTLMGSWTSRTQGSGPLKIYTESWRCHSVLHHGVCNQQARAYWTNLCGGHHDKPAVPAITAKWSHSNRKCGHIFSSRMMHAHITANVILVVLHDMSGSHFLLNQFPEYFMYGHPWPPCSLNINPCSYFLWGYLKDGVYCTNPHTVQEFQLEI
jgi:hypothetical protein